MPAVRVDWRDPALGGRHVTGPGGVQRSGLRQSLGVMRNRNYALFWTGSLLSNAGTWMQNATVPFIFYSLTGSAVWTGLAGFVQLFPSVLLTPVSGSLADRFQRRHVLLVANAALALLAVALWVTWGAGVRSPSVILALVAGNGVVFGLLAPSWQGFVSELVPREQLLPAVTLNAAQFNGARAIGPALGGVVLARYGPSWSFVANALSFVAVIVALALMRLKPVPRADLDGRVLHQFVESLRYVRRHRGIVLAIVVVGAVGFLASPVFQLTPVLARVHGVGAGLYGVLGAAYGVGAVLGAVVLGAVGGSVPRSRLVLAAALLCSAALAGVGLAPGFVVCVIALGFVGMGFLLAMATLNTSVQLMVDEEMRGRVMAVYFAAFTAGYPVGSLVQGAVADRIGAPTTVVVAGGVLFVVALALAARRRLPLLDQAADTAPATAG